MSIFRGPGILLNPSTVANPSSLPQAFALTLAAGTNTCALTDELGAIAYTLQEGESPETGRKLFRILESDYSLIIKAGDISKCLARASSDTLQSAMLRSLRAFERGRQTDEKIAAILVQHDTITAAAKALGLVHSTVDGRIRYAADDSPLSAFKGVFKRRGVSEEEIIDALERHETARDAAQDLGIAYPTLYGRIRYAAADSPLSAYKDIFKRGRYSNEELVAALEQHDTITAAAKTLGISSVSISLRIMRAFDDSPLAAFKGVFKSGKRKCSDEELVAALEQHDTITAAAKTLGISSISISLRITRAFDDSPLAAFKGVFKGGKRKCSDEVLVAALQYHDTIKAAAQTLGVLGSSISLRIMRAPADSPLAAFKGVFKGGKRKCSDEELVAVLEQYDTNRAAVRALGITYSELSKRIRMASDDSPLAAFMGRTRLRTSDELIAFALEHHETAKAAAQAIGISPGTVSRRIHSASDDSPLAAFKGMPKRRRIELISHPWFHAELYNAAAALTLFESSQRYVDHRSVMELHGHPT